MENNRVYVVSEESVPENKQAQKSSRRVYYIMIAGNHDWHLPLVSQAC